MIDQKNVMVLGAEAASFAAIDAGAKAIFAYPGTPSTEAYECGEYLVHKLNDGRAAHIGANEKVAYEYALGASYAGHRTMVTMKHVGLNVAMDAFVNSAMTGVNGGLIVLVADDPGMHSSQNEQDSRLLADFAMVPVFSPSTPQEVYDQTIKAFELSEKYKTPVMLRLTTRLAHARQEVKRINPMPIVSLGKPQGDDKLGWVLMPAIARKQNDKLRAKQNDFVAFSSQNNLLKLSGKKGVVVSDMGRAYYQQLLISNPELLKYSSFEITNYPVNEKDLQKMSEYCDEIVIFEDGYPYLEDQLLKLSKHAKICGRRSNHLPFAGELSPLNILKALNLKTPDAAKKASIDLPQRPPRLCDGCGHADAYKALTTSLEELQIKDYRIFGDIGCYTLGMLPPFNGLHTCVEMGASAGMALGAAYVDMAPSIGVIGDSTFFHSGLSTMVSMAQCKKSVTLVIMDNRITAMTGQQQTIAHDIIPKLALAAGFSDEQIHVLTPLPKNHQQNIETLKNVFLSNRPNIVIFKRDCVQAMRKGLYAQFTQN